MKRFVRGSVPEPNLDLGCSSSKLNPKNERTITGEEAKRTYEEVLRESADLHVLQVGAVGSAQASTSASTCKSPLVPVRKTQKQKQSPSTNINTLMKHAERDDVEAVAEALEVNDDLLNSVDSFGWSLLMCASCAGARGVVQYLLSAGAHTDIADRSGNSCVLLAKKRGHMDIVRMILNHKVSCRQQEEESHDSAVPEETTSATIFCDSCQIDVPDTQQQRHITSTIHLFSEHSGSLPTMYGIPESNRGYQLMLKEGWNRESGLGPRGDGRKLPPKTVLKTDRKGVGAIKLKPRVTHFAANDPSAVSSTRARKLRPERQPTRKDRERYMQREKRKERQLRQELS